MTPKDQARREKEKPTEEFKALLLAEMAQHTAIDFWIIGYREGVVPAIPAKLSPSTVGPGPYVATLDWPGSPGHGAPLGYAGHSGHCLWWDTDGKELPKPILLFCEDAPTS